MVCGGARGNCTATITGGDTYEAVAGFRPNTRQLIKAGYTAAHVRAGGARVNTWSAELVTTLHPISLAWN